MSSKHEAILQFMIGNPTLKMSEVAAYFGVTPAWLSTIVHSHAFQDQLARRQDELFEVAIVQELGDKLTAAAHQTIDAYLEQVPTLTADQLISAQDKLLGRLGYGVSKGTTNFNIEGSAQVQVNQVGGDVLAKAREKVGKTNGKATLGTADNEPALPIEQAPAPAQIEGDSVREESELRSNGALRDSTLHSEPVVQVPEVRGQDKVLPD